MRNHGEISTAEERIAHAAASGQSRLVLNGLQMTHLPVSLLSLQNLTDLELEDNELQELPEWIGSFPKLARLSFTANKIERLPATIADLGSLTELLLNHNQFTRIPQVLSQMGQIKYLGLFKNYIGKIPDWLGDLVNLEYLAISGSTLTNIPSTIAQLAKLERLFLGWQGVGSPLGSVPEAIRQLKRLRKLDLSACRITKIPDWICELKDLEELTITDNKLVDIPVSIYSLSNLAVLDLRRNPLNPELKASTTGGITEVLRYLSARADAHIKLFEAKLILVGEGEVGKSCLLGALRGDPWIKDRSSTHGIEIKPVTVYDQSSKAEIKLNGWDFGGQRVYRPTHQLFFSAPAIYLVVWKPREGSQQGFVKDWIKLIKHRAPDAKILVVATHGGPKERQPDIDRQELWDLFGKDTVIDFFHVDSRPTIKRTQDGSRIVGGRGVATLRRAISQLAASLPEMGRAFPRLWQDARSALRDCSEAYLPLSRVLEICGWNGLSEEESRLLLLICSRVGDFIYYEHDTVLKDFVVLRPDWLATAISLVLDDRYTRDVGHGLINYDRLRRLWQVRARASKDRYSDDLHPMFLRLMERHDLSYKIVDSVTKDTSLIAQLVPDLRPEPVPGWNALPNTGDVEQVQICRIVDGGSHQSALAEGLFFQLIVRLHKYSLGRADYSLSVHWQRGLILEDDTGARAYLEHVGNDIRITVRSPYPERFLSALTYEVKWLVESFWSGLSCEVTVPCLFVGKTVRACAGLFEVSKLIENKKRGRSEQPCPICNQWQSIEGLLHNAPASRPSPIDDLLSNSAASLILLSDIRSQIRNQNSEVFVRFDSLDSASKEIISRVEAAYTGVMNSLVDEARDGPRLFSIEPVNPRFFDRPNWLSAKFRITLWCEHSRLPLPALNRGGSQGVYEINVPRAWITKAAPFLKVLNGALGLIVPIASSVAKIALDDRTYKGIEKQLAVGEKALDAVLKGGDQIRDWITSDDGPGGIAYDAIEAQGAVLRQLQVWLKDIDPGFGELIRVQNKRREFLWVHEVFQGEY